MLVMLSRAQTRVMLVVLRTKYSSPLVRTFFLFNMTFCRVSKEKKSCLFPVMKATMKINQVLLYKTQMIKRTRRSRTVCSLTLALTYNSPRRESK